MRAVFLRGGEIFLNSLPVLLDVDISQRTAGLFLRARSTGGKVCTIYLATRLCAVSATLLIIFLYLCSLVLADVFADKSVIEIARACR
jgi:hypothetical protein